MEQHYLSSNHWCSLEVQRSRCMVERMRAFEQIVSDTSFSLFFFNFCFFFTICHAPDPPPWWTKGVRNCTRTLYFFFPNIGGSKSYN